MSNSLVDGDGFVDSLFYALYHKDSHENSCPEVLIPPSIVYKYRQPAFWYYTSFVRGFPDLTLREKQSLKSKTIYDDFSKNTQIAPNLKNDTDIVAMYVCNQTRTVSPDGEGATLVEYFDRNSLSDFVFRRSKTEDGVLQKFVPPKDGKNMVIRTTWTPVFCFVERKINRHKIDNRHLDIYERTVCWEGGDHHSSYEPIRSQALVQRINRQCVNMVEHIRKNTTRSYEVIRMVVNFKMDSANRLWFLYCSGLRMGDTEEPIHYPVPLGLGAPALVPAHISIHNFSTYSFATTMRKEFNCPNCDDLTERHRIKKVMFEEVIEQYEKSRQGRIARLIYENEDAEFDIDEMDDEEEDGGGKEEDDAKSPGTDPYARRKSLAPDDRFAKAVLQRKAIHQLVHEKYFERKKQIIPPVLRRLYPNMAGVHYMNKLRNHSMFLRKELEICDKCFYRIKVADSVWETCTQNEAKYYEMKRIKGISVDEDYASKPFLERNKPVLPFTPEFDNRITERERRLKAGGRRPEMSTPYSDRRYAKARFATPVAGEGAVSLDSKDEELDWNEPQHVERIPRRPLSSTAEIVKRETKSYTEGSETKEVTATTKKIPKSMAIKSVFPLASTLHATRQEKVTDPSEEELKALLKKLRKKQAKRGKVNLMMGDIEGVGKDMLARASKGVDETNLFNWAKRNERYEKLLSSSLEVCETNPDQLIKQLSPLGRKTNPHKAVRPKTAKS